MDVIDAPDDLSRAFPATSTIAPTAAASGDQSVRSAPVSACISVIGFELIGTPLGHPNSLDSSSWPTRSDPPTSLQKSILQAQKHRLLVIMDVIYIDGKSSGDCYI
jgi:hypothetical protein